MPELGFQDRSQSKSSGFRHRDVSLSPDSAIFTVESSFSLFSSASGSVERCSFASDVHDHDSDVSLHLAGHDYREASSGPDPDPNKVTVHMNSHLSRKEKAKVQKLDSETETEDDYLTLDSARNSFSRALKECQDRRTRSEIHLKKSDRRRPASLDLNNSLTNVTSSSPRFGAMKKNTAANRRTGTFPSPGTPNYRHAGVGLQKGWNSERVPLHTDANRRHVGNALLPFNNGRALPSKWEDAERWILSPVSGDSAIKTSSYQQPQRRPKSKSGPLGPPGIAYESMYSPAVHMFDGRNVVNLIADSPFSAGLMATDALSIRCSTDREESRDFALGKEVCMARSVSVHGCSQLVCQTSLADSQDKESRDERLDAATNTSGAVSRRDMATQMSPESSPKSTHRMHTCLSPSNPNQSILPIVELQSSHSSKLEVRDVEVDERVTMTRWSKKHRALISGRGSENGDEWRRKAVRSAGLEVSEAAKTISKMKREEARITAWENLQKAKAEAAMRKLEMKLEKKRSSSMDKIMNKLRSAQKKAQEMRSSMLANQTHQVTRTSHRAISIRRTRHMGSLSGCFTCHVF